MRSSGPMKIISKAEKDDLVSCFVHLSGAAKTTLPVYKPPLYLPKVVLQDGQEWVTYIFKNFNKHVFTHLNLPG